MAHYVLEHAAKDREPIEASDLAKLLEKYWSQSLEEEIVKIKGSPLNAHLLDPTKWPRYYLQWARTMELAKKIVTERGNSFHSSPDPLRLIEEWMESRKWKLIGKVDRVNIENQEPVIIDWKSTLGEENDEVDQAYYEQVLLYSVLYFERTGKWPVKGRLVSLSGATREFTIDKVGALKLAAEVAGLLDNLNKKIESGETSALASPAKKHCQYCSFKGDCVEFWKKTPRVLESDFPGVLSSVNLKSASSWSVNIGTPTLESKEVMLVKLNPTQFKYLKDFKVGSKVSVMGFYQSNSEPLIWYPKSTSVIHLYRAS